MPSKELLKNKKLLSTLGLLFVLIIGFFAFKMLSGGGQEEVKTESRNKKTVERTQLSSKPERKIQPAAQTKENALRDSSAKAVKADSTQKLPGETPLYQMLKTWRDPFGNGNRRITELEESIKIIKMQIELLRDSLEQEKLKDELAKMKKGNSPTPVFSSKPASNTQVRSQDKIIVKAILISEIKRTALLYMSSKKAWVTVGDLFEGWLVSEINSDKVVLTRDGRNLILGYHPFPSIEGGRNE
jgi:hypothetical protein